MTETSEFVISKFPLKLRKYTDKIVKKTLINGKIVLRIVCPSIDIANPQLKQNIQCIIIIACLSINKAGYTARQSQMVVQRP